MDAIRPPRKPTPTDVETAVLAKSARRCALCFHLEGDLKEKLGQIAHLDEDRSNSREGNLAFRCLPHHSLFDSTTSQHKNYTISEVKVARDRLYALVAEGKHLTPDSALPYLQADADKKVFRDFIEALPSNGAIRFIRNHDFGGAFERKRIDEIGIFVWDRGGPDHEFLDPELEAARRNLMKSCETFLSAIGQNTCPAHGQGWYAVPNEWDPGLFMRAVKEIDNAADDVCTAYDQLVRLARKKLAV